MAKLLHILSSAMGENAYSARVAEAFLASYRETHPDDEVETFDIWAADLPGYDASTAKAKYNVMKGLDHSDAEAEAWNRVVQTIDHFKSADKYLLSVGMWNFSIPYRLKQYIDVIVQPGLTFGMTADGGFEGLVTGRPAQLVLARGGIYGE